MTETLVRGLLTRLWRLLPLGGLALAIWLVLRENPAAVLTAFAAVGWGMAALVAVRLLILFLCAIAWGLLVRRLAAIPGHAFQLVRFIREAVNVMLPVAAVGGDILGATLITRMGLPAGLAGASVLVDVLLQATAQAAFTLLGTLLLAGVAGAESVVHWSLFGLAVASVALGAFFLVQRRGGAAAMERAVAWVLARLGRSAAAGRTIGLQAGLAAIWADRGAVALGFALHVVAWLVGVLEVWIALWSMGAAVTLAQATILESLAQALRGAAFPVPAGIGVQEGGFVLLGMLLGVPAEAALALSLAKRVPDVVLGLPGLLAWQVLERRPARG